MGTCARTCPPACQSGHCRGRRRWEAQEDGLQTKSCVLAGVLCRARAHVRESSEQGAVHRGRERSGQNSGADGARFTGDGESPFHWSIILPTPTVLSKIELKKAAERHARTKDPITRATATRHVRYVQCAIPVTLNAILCVPLSCSYLTMCPSRDRQTSIDSNSVRETQIRQGRLPAVLRVVRLCCTKN